MASTTTKDHVQVPDQTSENGDPLGAVLKHFKEAKSDEERCD